jgi:hypothetical protein
MSSRKAADQLIGRPPKDRHTESGRKIRRISKRGPRAQLASGVLTVISPTAGYNQRGAASPE